MPDHSYVTIRSRLSASVQDILASVTEKLQYSEEQGAREDALVLVTVASSGGGHGAWGGGQGIGEVVLTPPQFAVWAEKAVLQPSEECVFTTLGINSHLFACTRDAFDSLVSTGGGPFWGPMGMAPPGSSPFLSSLHPPRHAGAAARGDPGGPGGHGDPPRGARGHRQPPHRLPLGALPLHPRGAQKNKKTPKNPREKGF